MTNDKSKTLAPHASAGVINRKSKIVVGTRGSALAQWQTNYVIAALKCIAPDLEIETRIIKTTGDKDQARSLADLGGLGVFTKEIENALLAHEIDLAVHSLKDLPTETASGLTIAAIPEREDPRDCIVSRHGVGLMQLPRGTRVGTSSARRAAQVLALRPDAQIVPLRGNVDTRLRKAQSDSAASSRGTLESQNNRLAPRDAASEYDAVVLAAAGIIRLGRASEITEFLPLDTFLPDPGQGALAIEIRADDVELLTVIAQLDHVSTRAAVTAERAFLRALGSGCRMPIGAYAEMHANELHLHGMIASNDGLQIARGEVKGDAIHAEELGAQLATKLVGARHSPILDIQTANSDKPNKPSDQHLLANASPLRGRKILITRARDQAPALAEKIRTLGGEPIEFPTIDFAPLEDFRAMDAALARVCEFDWVVFTSVNGVHAVAERMRTLEIEPRALASAKLAAIGPATARALEELGLRVDFIPTQFLGKQVAIELPIQRGQRVLLLRADIASDVLARGLGTRGVTVTDVAAYCTIVPSKSDVDLKQIEVVTFTSSSTVRNFVAMQNGHGHDAIRHLKTFCIGPVTAETARELGLRVDAIATEHTMDGLVETIAQYYQPTESQRP